MCSRRNKQTTFQDDLPNHFPTILDNVVNIANNMDSDKTFSKDQSDHGS